MSAVNQAVKQDIEAAPVVGQPAMVGVNGQPIVIVQEEQLPVGLILFICGFCVCIAWWIGACYPPVRTQKDQTWRKINLIMTILSVLLIILIIVLNVVFFSVAISTSSSVINAKDIQRETINNNSV
jgi:hypothetical protein